MMGLEVLIVFPKETKNTGNFPGERGLDHLIPHPPHPPHPSTSLWIIIQKSKGSVMVLSFINLKHSVYISVSFTSNMMILFYIYMDHLPQLLRNLNLVLSFLNLKHSVYISVSCTSNMMIPFYIYMDHLPQLLRNLNSSA